MASTTVETIGITVCANCGTRESDDTKLKTCNACKMARYCCRDCQVSHWPRHKEACKKRAAELFDKELFKDPPEREECPICMLPFPFDGGTSRFFACCGRIICNGCVTAQFEEDVTNCKELPDCNPCPFCRTPIPDDKERLHRVYRCVERNHAPSINQLAYYYNHGVSGLEKDIGKAIELFQKAGKLGHANSYNDLGTIYRDGRDGVEIDMKKARYYLELGTIGGSITARCNLASLDWQDGDSKRAFKHCLICAKAGDAHALENLKYGCKKGDVTKDEYAEALRAYQKQHDDTRSENRDRASHLKKHAEKHGMGRNKMYHAMRAIRGNIPSLYYYSCLDWDEGKFSRACEAFLHCAKFGWEPALKRLKIGVEKGYVTADEYSEALRVYNLQLFEEEWRNATGGEAPAVQRVDNAKSKAVIHK